MDIFVNYQIRDHPSLSTSIDQVLSMYLRTRFKLVNGRIILVVGQINDRISRLTRIRQNQPDLSST